jgi:hypothetical protein
VKAPSRFGPGLLWCLGTVALFTACSSSRTVTESTALQGKGALAKIEPGLILITSPAQPAEISFDPPNDRVESAAEGAEAAVRSALDTPHLGHAQLEAAVSVLETAVIPFAAAYGAVAASRQRVPPDKLSEAELTLLSTLRTNAGPEALREKVAAAARQKTSRLLLCAPSVAGAPRREVPTSAELEVAVEQLNLKNSKPGKNDYVLCIRARARLLSAPNGAVLLDRHYNYTSGPAMYIDWTRQSGLTGVAQTGYQSLAEEIARDVFQPVAEPPLRIGPGQKHSLLQGGRVLAGQWKLDAGSSELGCVHCQYVPAGPQRSIVLGSKRGWRDAGWRLTGLTASTRAGGFRLVSSVEAPETSIEIHTGKPDQRLRVQTPGAGLQDSAAGQPDAEWALDGMENDRNAVVQFVACLASVPIGLWEQTVGAVRQRSLGKTEKLTKGLDRIPDEMHFPKELAGDVARRLRSQVINPVRTTEEPLKFALALPRGEREQESERPIGSVNSQLALNLEVVNVKLLGKHLSSRSRALCVEIKATVLRTSDGQELYTRPIIYRSAPRALKDWGGSDAKLLRQELDACSRQAAEALTHELITRGFATPGANPSAPNPL